MLNSNGIYRISNFEVIGRLDQMTYANGELSNAIIVGTCVVAFDRLQRILQPRIGSTKIVPKKLCFLNRVFIAINNDGTTRRYVDSLSNVYGIDVGNTWIGGSHSTKIYAVLVCYLRQRLPFRYSYGISGRPVVR